MIGGSPERTVISLVGEGGIGKTTLANKVYKDVEAKGCFDCHVWITVSQSHNVERILRIMQNRVCPAGESETIEEAIELLRNALREKRYVVVFDDVWQVEFWSLIKLALPSNEKGSRVIVTTRNSTVADSFKERAGDVIQEVKAWSREQAMKLFCRRAFSDFEGHCPSELLRLSSEFVTKCRGLPLVIVTIAGILSQKEKIESVWQNVLDNLNHEFKEHKLLESIEAYHGGVGFAKDLEKLTKLKVLSVGGLTTEIGRTMGASTEKMSHLEKLCLFAINLSVILDLQDVSLPPSLTSLGLSCRRHKFSNFVPKLQNIQFLHLGFSRLKSETFKILAGLCNLVYLTMYMSYEGEELHFEEGSFLKLKELHLRAFKGLKSLKLDRGALPRLEQLHLGALPLMTEKPSSIRNLESLNDLEILDMMRELVVRLLPNGGVDYQNFKHIASIMVAYKRNETDFGRYRLGSSELVQRLQEQTSL